MKNLITAICILIISFTLPVSNLFSSPNLTVNATTGSSGMSYSTLKDAFEAINQGVHQGSIKIMVGSSTNETETAVLNASGSGSASYTSILIYPTVSGAIVTGSISGALISLNGADYVTFDGRVNQAGAKDMIISNTSTNSSASTIKLSADACGNTFTYCTIKGSTTNSSGGVIYFGTGTTTGNDSNTISYCDVRENGANRPRNCIYSSGTAAKENGYNVITNSNIYCFYGGTSSAGININTNTTNWTITNNSFYEDDLLAGVASATIYGIYANTGSGYTITGNYIGGNTSNCGGDPWTVNGTSASYNFIGIYLNVGTASATSVQNNTIQNFIWLSTTTGGFWTGIYVNSGNVNVGNVTGNTIGAPTGTGSVNITAGANSGSCAGIISKSSNTVNISNNNIGSLTLSASTFGSTIYGIYVSPANSTGTTTIGNNLIGSLTTANSINNNAGSSNYQSVYGIFGMGFAATGTLNVTNNTLANINNNTTTSSGISSSVYGMYLSSAGLCSVTGNAIRDLTNNSSYVAGNNYGTVGLFLGTSQQMTISQNTIYNISNINTGIYTTGVLGIYHTAVNPGGTIISRNRIYALSNSSSSSGTIDGIVTLYAGSTDFTNNQISLGTGTPGNISIYGINIYDSGPFNFYYNTIYIGGNAGGTTYAFYRYIFTGTNTTTLKNNILYNGRTGGGSAYVFGNCYSNPGLGLAANASNYNVFIGSTASKIGVWWYTDCTFATWKTSSSCDANSWYTIATALNATDLFRDPVNGDLTVKSDNQACWYVSGKGMPVSACTSDFSSNSIRSSSVITGSTDIGSTEFTPSVSAINATSSGSHTVNGTETFTFAGRTVGTITWGSTGTLPTVNYFKYNIGMYPGNPSGNYANGHWEINATGGSGYTYTVTLYYDPNMTGTITDESNIRIAKSEDNSLWNHWDGSVVNTTNKTVSVAGLNSFSYFTLSDATAPLPVALGYFNASTEGNNVKLNWETLMELNNSGFDIERKSKGEDNWIIAGSVRGSGTTNSSSVYAFTDSKLKTGSYQYRLRQKDYNGNTELFSLPAGDVVIKQPGKFSLGQSYPNPSNPKAKIDFELPFDAKVTIKIFDITGREVQTILDGYKAADFYSVEFDGSSLASGVYFYHLSTASGTGNNLSKTMKLILVK